MFSSLSRATTQSFATKAIFAGFVLAALAPAAIIAEGVYYEAVQKVVDAKKKNAQTQWRVRGWVDGSSAKVEFLDSTSPIFPKGSFMVTKDGGTEILVVDPKERTYSRWDLEALFASFGSVIQGMDGLVNVDFTDLSTEVLQDEAGPEVLGMSTRHVRSATGYGIQVKVVGMRRSWSVKSEQDVWVTNDIEAPGMFVWLKAAPSTGDEDFDQLIKAEMNRVDGLALKLEATSRLINKKGKEQVSTSSMEVTTLRKEAVPATTFEVPAGYTEVEASDPTGAGSLQSIFGKKSG